MNLEFRTVGGHTFAPSLLSDGVIIDVGCRDFSFATFFSSFRPDLAKNIYCIDPDGKVFEKDGCHIFNNMNLAISDKSGESAYYENGEATCLKEIDPDQNHPFKPCKTITMDELYKITGENVDILKLDCEGAEYIILGETFKPIPKQISVEFHHHTVPDLHNQHYKNIVERLSQHYTMHNDVWEQRHGCGFNFWDTLFIRKDLL